MDAWSRDEGVISGGDEISGDRNRCRADGPILKFDGTRATGARCPPLQNKATAGGKWSVGHRESRRMRRIWDISVTRHLRAAGQHSAAGYRLTATERGRRGWDVQLPPDFKVTFELRTLRSARGASAPPLHRRRWQLMLPERRVMATMDCGRRDWDPCWARRTRRARPRPSARAVS